MTIKQQGGIFGRNPTFNDLTAGSGSSIEGSGENITFSVNRTDASTAGALVLRAAGGTLSIDSDGADKDILIRTGGGTERARFYGDSGDFSIKGNLIVDSGNGIDFSATSGTGTSELLDDYEEGTWTPVYDASTSSPTVTHDKQTGYYVKIGRMVFISLQLRTDSVSGGSGNLRISGLPYSAGSGDGYPSALSVGYKADFVTNGPDFAHVNDGQTYLSLYSNGTTVATPLTVANLNTGSNDNGLYISGSYLTA